MLQATSPTHRSHGGAGGELRSPSRGDSLQPTRELENRGEVSCRGTGYRHSPENLSVRCLSSGCRTSPGTLRPLSPNPTPRLTLPYPPRHPPAHPTQHSHPPTAPFPIHKHTAARTPPVGSDGRAPALPPPVANLLVSPRPYHHALAAGLAVACIPAPRRVPRKHRCPPQIPWAPRRAHDRRPPSVPSLHQTLHLHPPPRSSRPPNLHPLQRSTNGSRT
jgi:hypothetical protein